MHDDLTQLPLRKDFMDALRHHAEQAQQSASMLGLMVVDIHRMRCINATFGYDAGDAVLAMLADHLRTVARPQDFPARIGNDEFALLMPGIRSADHAGLAANKLFASINANRDCGGHDIRVKAMAGIAVFPGGSDRQETLLRDAELALLRARTHGVSYEIYVDDAACEPSLSVVLESDLQDAIENCALVPYFQPKIDLRSQRICGLEELSRWQHPDHGWISPEVFVAAAERCGLIMPLTIWSLNAALHHRSACRDIFGKLPIAVNLSAHVLHDAEIVDLILRTVRTWGVDPDELTLEITETAMMVNAERSLKTLQQLRDAGIRLSIDDFGTGHASLTYLKRLPVQELKIDRSFIHQLSRDAGDLSIVRAIIDLAHNFGLEVVAEGVEDPDTQRCLTGLGCDHAQGFLVSPPLPAEQIGEFLKRSMDGGSDQNPCPWRGR